MSADDDAHDRAHEALAHGDVTGWFDPLYAAAARGEAVVPWDRGGPHPMLTDWMASGAHRTGRAVVVGAGPGHDAGYLAQHGWQVTGFDVSAAAVAAAHQRYPQVDLQVANLFRLPAGWRAGFDLVVESMTVQAMPRNVRPEAIEAVRSLVAPGGTLLVMGMHLPTGQELEQGPPWPLTLEELHRFEADGLTGRLVSDLDLMVYRLELHGPAGPATTVAS